MIDGKSIDRESAIANLEQNIRWIEDNEHHQFPGWGNVVVAMRDAVELLKEQPEIVLCKDCKHWDTTTQKSGNDIIFGPWCDAVCNIFSDLDTYGELGEDFRRTNGNWYCGDGEKRDYDG